MVNVKKKSASCHDQEYWALTLDRIARKVLCKMMILMLCPKLKDFATPWEEKEDSRQREKVGNY